VTPPSRISRSMATKSPQRLRSNHRRALSSSNYAFVVQGDTLKGKGEVDFGGQTYGSDFDLKRGGETATGQQPSQPAPQPPRREVPQPSRSNHSIYFVGQWSFNWIGRESALGPAPREGTTTFTLLPMVSPWTFAPKVNPMARLSRNSRDHVR